MNRKLLIWTICIITAFSSMSVAFARGGHHSKPRHNTERRYGGRDATKWGKTGNKYREASVYSLIPEEDSADHALPREDAVGEEDADLSEDVNHSSAILKTVTGSINLPSEDISPFFSAGLTMKAAGLPSKNTQVSSENLSNKPLTSKIA